MNHIRSLYGRFFLRIMAVCYLLAGLLFVAAASIRAGIALKNVHQRLQLFFGPAYGLEITSAAGIGTQIELCMPAPSEMRDSYHAERAF